MITSSEKVLIHLALLIALVTSAACSSGEERGPERISGWAVNDDGQLQVLIDTCNGDAKTYVVEDDDQVTVTVVSTRTRPGNDCLDLIDVPLTTPLGDRTLIDGLSGREAPEGLSRDHLEP